MIRLGDYVYSWCDINKDVEIFFETSGPIEHRTMKTYAVIGTVIDMKNNVISVSLVENPNIVIGLNESTLYHVGKGPLMKANIPMETYSDLKRWVQ